MVDLSVTTPHPEEEEELFRVLCRVISTDGEQGFTHGNRMPGLTHCGTGNSIRMLEITSLSEAHCNIGGRNTNFVEE